MSAKFFDLMKYAATGIASPSMTGFDKLLALSMSGAKVQSITGVPPISFKGNGTPLISWSMLGNDEHGGTPTPTTPITPQGTGDRTANLWDENYSNGYYNSSGTFISANNQLCTQSKIAVKPNTTYWLGVYSPSTAAYLGVVKYNETGVFIERVNTTAYIGNGVVFTTDANTYYININFGAYYGEAYNDDIIIAESSTALPYEPYGYKIQLTNAGQTVPVYLGQTQTVRRIKKLVLDGTEEWLLAGDNVFYLASISPDYLRGENKILAICTHYQSSPQTASAASVPEDSVSFSYTSYQRLYCCDTTRTNITDFKSYLAAQYAAGTPVTVWYVLAEPETAIVNEPLMKIGDYADELNSTEAQVAIPTVAGANTLTVGTTVQPSSMSITGKIKPVP